MEVSEREDGATKRIEPADGPGLIPPATVKTAPGIKTIVVSLAVALAAGVLAWGVGNRFRVAEVVDVDDFWGGSALTVASVSRNGVVAFAALGAMLSLGLGLTASLLGATRSVSRGLIAAIAGSALSA